MTNRRRNTFFAVALAAVTLAVYARVTSFEFLLFDDPDYIVENAAVSGGLTSDSLRWAFTSFHSSNWHPLTWLSHMLDCELFGLDAGAHHLVNAFLHAVNAVLCFFLLAATTRRFWPSAFVAAAFALHPMRVQSVAWVSERKDVLSTLFFFGALLLWVRYARKPNAKTYIATLLVFACALLSKPSVVTFPVVALLLDRWPLARTESLKRLLLEKLPFALLAAGSVLATFAAQRASGALASLGEIPLEARIANSFVGYAFYVVRGIAPINLAYFYPHPAIVDAGWNPWGATTLASIAGFAVITVFALRSLCSPNTHRPNGSDFSGRAAVALGWLWFVVTLLPMIGLVQVGEQAYADRYAYVPLIGIAIAAAFGPKLEPGSTPARVYAGGLVAVLVTWTALTVVELPRWRDSGRLFARALDVTESNYMAEAGMGNVLRRANRLSEAREFYGLAIEHRADFPEALFSLGLIEHEMGNADRAAALYRRALLASPGLEEAHLNLGALLGQTGDLGGAIEEFAAVLALASPTSAPWTSAFANLEGMGRQLDVELRKQTRQAGLGQHLERIQQILTQARSDSASIQ